jgi:hypothetical protein
MIFTGADFVNVRGTLRVHCSCWIITDSQRDVFSSPARMRGISRNCAPSLKRINGRAAATGVRRAQVVRRNHKIVCPLANEIGQITNYFVVNSKQQRGVSP